MNHPNIPNVPNAPAYSDVIGEQRARAAAQQRPPRPPTAWESIPPFIRFAIWVISILTVIWLVVLPVMGVVLLAGAGFAAGV